MEGKKQPKQQPRRMGPGPSSESTELHVRPSSESTQLRRSTRNPQDVTAAVVYKDRPSKKESQTPVHLPRKRMHESPLDKPPKKGRLHSATDKRRSLTQSRPFKICDVSRHHRVGVVAATLQELRTKIPGRLPHIGDNFEVVLEEDCTRIEDEDYFQTLPNNTVLMVVSKGQKWAQASTSLAATHMEGHVEVDGQISSHFADHLAQVANKISRNPALLAFLPKADLEVVADSNINELQVLLHQSREDAQFIQDACERRLNEQVKSDEAAALLKLYHRAKSKCDGESQ